MDLLFRAFLFDDFYVDRFRLNVTPDLRRNITDHQRLHVYELVLDRLDKSGAKDNADLYVSVRPLGRAILQEAEKFMNQVVNTKDKTIKPRLAEIIRRALVDWTD